MPKMSSRQIWPHSPHHRWKEDFELVSKVHETRDLLTGDRWNWFLWTSWRCGSFEIFDGCSGSSVCLIDEKTKERLSLGKTESRSYARGSSDDFFANFEGGISCPDSKFIFNLSILCKFDVESRSRGTKVLFECSRSNKSPQQPVVMYDKQNPCQYVIVWSHVNFCPQLEEKLVWC